MRQLPSVRKGLPVNLSRLRLVLRLVIAATALDASPGYAQLPSEWSTRDIGQVGATGSTGRQADDYLLEGSGADIWGAADAFRFAYTRLAGDGSITARVTRLDAVHGWTKAGVMIRESLASGSRHAFMLTSAPRGHAFQRRTATSRTSTHTSGGRGTAPVWLRLTRAGNTFSAFSSADGVHWRVVGRDTIPMAATVYVGLALTSHRAGVVAGAAFDQVTVAAQRPREPETDVAGEDDDEPEDPPAPASGGTTRGTLRVVHWNVHHAGRRTDGVVDRDGLTRWLASFRADVISLNELDSLANLRDIVTRLERRTGNQWHYSYDYGIAVVSRFPLEAQSSCVINSSLGRRIVQATVIVNGRSINIWSLHHDAYSARTRQSEVRATRACTAAFAEPRIIAGDFNAQSGSPEIREMAAHYTDAWAAARARRAATNYSGNCDGCTRRSRIDYVFSSSGSSALTLRSAQIFDTRDRRGVMPSDHKPMLVVYDVR